MSGVFDVFFCCKCKTSFIEPPKNLADYYKSDYFFDFQNEKSVLFKIKERVVMEKYKKTKNVAKKMIFNFLGKFISALPSKRGKILDFGCSCGDILVMLKKAGFDVYGMDISRVAVEKCQSHGLSNVSLGTEDDLSIYPDNFFDSIRASHVIEHMIDPATFIKLAGKKIKKDGELVIQTPNINSFGVFFGKHAKYYFDIPRHIILFSNKSIQHILRKNGFSNVKVSYINFFGDQIDNFYIFLKDKNLKMHKIFCYAPIKLITQVLFVPIEIILSCTGYSQTMTITATKN